MSSENGENRLIEDAQRHQRVKNQSMEPEPDIVTLAQIRDAYNFLKTCPDIINTPLLKHAQKLFACSLDESSQGAIEKEEIRDQIAGCDLYIKLENMQTTGSFKIRGVMNLMRKLRKKYGPDVKLVTMSAGNHGKAFAYCCKRFGGPVQAVCFMPDHTVKHRVESIESYGVEVRLGSGAELPGMVKSLVKEEGYHLCQGFDDLDIIAGHASAGMEMLEEVPDPDVVVVCCGGGGLSAGMSAVMALSGLKNCRVYAVEPVGAPGMYESFKQQRPATLKHTKTVAVGLSPPFAGAMCYKHCSRYLEDVLLVTDDEILEAMRILFKHGIKTEPSGCAAMAALLTGKIPDIEGKKVVIYITGGNVTCAELTGFIDE